MGNVPHLRRQWFVLVEDPRIDVIVWELASSCPTRHTIRGGPDLYLFPVVFGIRTRPVHVDIRAEASWVELLTTSPWQLGFKIPHTLDIEDM